MEIDKLLHRIDLFEGLTKVQLEMVASICQQRRCRGGEMIFEENSGSDEMYVVIDGRVEIQLDPSLVERPQPGEESELVTIATMRPGEIFGEIALVDQGVRTASARCAANDTKVLIIPRDKLMMLCTSFPDLGFRIMSNLAAELSIKIRSTDLMLREQFYRRIHG